MTPLITLNTFAVVFSPAGLMRQNVGYICKIMISLNGLSLKKMALSHDVCVSD